jgi:serine/threonine-protein kinase
MAAPPSIDRQTFLAYLRQSGLVTEEQLARASPALPESNRGRVLARALVERGLLTRFQAERLLVGRTAGFQLGQYRILEQLGRGGMGRVFKAEHRAMRRIVALKVLAAELLSTERAVELFLHEVRAAGRLVHPNIVTAYDANEAGGRYYLVLEYVDGPNLSQLVRAQGPLPVGLACDYVRQVAAGLECAHPLGMVHRDLKPSNLLVQRHGKGGDSAPGLVKISDFGLARLHAPALARPGDSVPGTILTQDNTVMGTPDYLSPEQARDLHDTDIRSDLYSLGCTFYFLLTGSVPFPGGSALDKMIRHSTEEPRPLGEFRPDVPAPVAAVVRRLMAKRPEDRFQSPAELAQALAPYAVSGPTPWAPRPPAPLPEAEPERTPLPEEDSGDIVPASDGELSALASTVAGDPSPTPRETGEGMACKRGRRRWVWGAAIFALAALLGGLGTLACLAWR